MNDELFDLKKVPYTDIKETQVNNHQRYKLKAQTDDIHRFQNHVNQEKDSKVLQYNSKQNDRYRGNIKNVNYVEKYQNGRSTHGCNHGQFKVQHPLRRKQQN